MTAQWSNLHHMGSGYKRLVWAGLQDVIKNNSGIEKA